MARNLAQQKWSRSVLPKAKLKAIKWVWYEKSSDRADLLSEAVALYVLYRIRLKAWLFTMRGSENSGTAGRR